MTMCIRCPYWFCVLVYDKRDLPLDDEEHEQYHVAKGKMLGNIKFIGENQ